MRISHGATIDKTIGKQYNKGNETRRNAMPRKSKYFLFEIVGDVPDFFLLQQLHNARDKTALSPQPGDFLRV